MDNVNTNTKDLDNMKQLVPTQTIDAYKALSDARNAMIEMQSNLSDDMQVYFDPILKHIDDAASELGALIGNNIVNVLYFDTIDC